MATSLGCPKIKINKKTKTKTATGALCNDSPLGLQRRSLGGLGAMKRLCSGVGDGEGSEVLPLIT